MSKDKTNTTKLGLFVTAAILLFAFGIYKIGEKENLFGSTFTISAIFQNVNGLQEGNNVRFSGINVGSVGDIIIINDSTLQVNMLLEDKVNDYLRKDATASIGTDGLVGNMIVNITPGEGKAAIVKTGDFIDSYARVETETMLSKLGNTTENIGLLTVNLLEVAEKINNGSGSVSRLINDNAIANDLQIAILNLRKTSEQINQLSKELKQSMELVNQGEGVLGYLLKDSLFETKINGTVDNLDNLIQDRTDPIIKHLEQSSKNIATTTADLKDLIQEIDLNNGLAGSILKDTVLSRSFKETMLNLNKGSQLLNEDLEALQHNFLFRRYFKKQEKRRKKEEEKRRKEELSVVKN